MSEPIFFDYSPRTMSEDEARLEAMWERVAREGADIIDPDGNVIGRAEPAPEKNADGSLTFNIVLPSGDDLRGVPELHVSSTSLTAGYGCDITSITETAPPA